MLSQSYVCPPDPLSFIYPLAVHLPSAIPELSFPQGQKKARRVTSRYSPSPFCSFYMGESVRFSVRNYKSVIPQQKTHQFPHIKWHRIRSRNCPPHADTQHALPGHSISSGEPVMKYRAMISGAQHAPTLFQTAITHPSWSVSYLRRITSCPVKSSVAPCSFS